MFKRKIEFLKSDEGQKQINIVRKLTELAEKGSFRFSRVPPDPRIRLTAHSHPRHTELGCTVTQLALAWVARNPNTSTVILGATKPEQLLENLKALEIVPKLTPEVLSRIDEITGNKPQPWVSFSCVLSRSPSRPFSRERSRGCTC